jgi:hypothetical protein
LRVAREINFLNSPTPRFIVSHPFLIDLHRSAIDAVRRLADPLRIEATKPSPRRRYKMRKLVVALSAVLISAAVSTTSASIAGSLTAGFDAVRLIGWQQAFDVADCSGGTCKCEEPQDPLASLEDRKPNSSSDPLQDCQGGCGSAKPEARLLQIADCGSGSCKYEEPQDPLASLEDSKRNSSSDPVQDCTSGGCAKREMPRAMLLADGCQGSSC